MSVTWEHIQAGEKLPELIKRPGVTQLVKYAAGSGDFNPLHHDTSFPQAKAIGSIIVHGRFKYAALGECVSNWLNHQGRIKTISCQYRGMDFPDSEITCKGTVVKKWIENGEKLVELEVWTEDSHGKQTTPGKAIVAF
ncbi:MAG: MaoC/PaaZ C-terminal domain-containing protein [bacterium]